jgi:hypothetical protein
VQIYVLKNNVQAGPFPLQDVRARLQQGEFTYADLAWHDGIPNWTPLGQILSGPQPGATPPAVPGWTTHTAAPPKAPIVARIVTAVVLFFVFFVVIYIVVAIVSFMIGGGIAGAHAAAEANAQGFNQGYSVGRQAGMQFRHDWGMTIVLGSLVFSLVTAPLAASLVAFSNLLPWCRKR